MSTGSWLRRRLVARDEGGSTLVETLVAIVIISVLLLGVIAAMSSSASISRTTGQVARTRAALAEVTDRVATMEYPGCAAPSALSATINSKIVVPQDYTVSVTETQGLLPTRDTCDSATTAFRVKVKVDHAASNTSLTGDVVLRDRNAKPA